MLNKLTDGIRIAGVVMAIKSLKYFECEYLILKYLVIALQYCLFLHPFIPALAQLL